MRALALRVSVVELGSLWLQSGCSPAQSKLEKPTPPDMSSVIQAFALPTADLNAQTASELSSPAHQASDLIAALGLDGSIVSGVLDAIQARQQDPQTMSAGVATRREGLLTDQGYMQITRLCNGWGAQPSPDPANGNMQLTIGFQDQTVDPVLWGTFTLCRYLGGSSQIQLAGAAGAASGPLNCYLGGPLPWANVGQTPLLFTVDFGVELNGAASLLQSAFRIDPVLDTIELLEHTSEGDLLVLLSAGSASLSQLLSVRAKNGNFSCDELARTCTSDTGATVSF